MNSPKLTPQQLAAIEAKKVAAKDRRFKGIIAALEANKTTRQRAIALEPAVITAEEDPCLKKSSRS